MLIIIVGASGVGKTSTQNELTKVHGIKKIITTTTRGRRPSELDNVDYHFKEISDFNKENMIDYTLFRDNYYGVSKEDIEDTMSDIQSIVLDGDGEFNLHNYCYEKNIPCATVLLDADLTTLISRISVEEHRMDRVGEGGEGLERERKGFIYDAFDLVVKTDNKSVSEVALEITKGIPRRR